MTPRKPLNRFRQLLRRRHPGAFDEDRDNPHVRLRQSGRNFKPHVIVLLFQPSPAGRIFSVEPLAADQSEARVCVAKANCDRVYEVLAGFEGIDIAKYCAFAQAPFERFAKTPGIPCRVFSPVTDEDLRHAWSVPLGVSRRIFALMCRLAQRKPRTLPSAQPQSSKTTGMHAQNRQRGRQLDDALIASRSGVPKAIEPATTSSSTATHSKCSSRDTTHPAQFFTQFVRRA